MLVFCIKNRYHVTNWYYLLFLIGWLSISIGSNMANYLLLVSKFSWVILFGVRHRFEGFVLGCWQVVFRHKKNGCPCGCRFSMCRKG